MRFATAVAACLMTTSCASLPSLHRTSETIPCPPIPPPPPPKVFSAKCLERPEAMPQPTPVLTAEGNLDQLRTARGYVTDLKSWGGIVLENYTACIESHEANAPKE